MNCKKCEKLIPDDAIFCCYCGVRQEKRPYRRRRSNGEGTVYKRGSTWTAKKVTFADGKKYENTKGGFATKSEAYSWCNTPVEKREEEHRVTMAQLYTKWLERHKDRVSHSTINCYRAAFNYYKPIYTMPFATLTTEDWQQCVDAVEGKRTRQNMKALGTQLYKYAAEQQIIHYNYASHIWIGSGDESDSYTPFTAEQLQKILDVALAGDDEAALIAIDCYTGFRPVELFAITKDAYDGRVIRGGAKTEAGKNRIVPVSQKIKPLVDRFYQRSKDLLFAIDIPSAKAWRDHHFYKELARLGIQDEDHHDLMPYSCRHTFATMLKATKAGEALDKSRLMGHTSPNMTEHYQHSREEELTAIINQL